MIFMLICWFHIDTRYYTIVTLSKADLENVTIGEQNIQGFSKSRIRRFKTTKATS